MNKLSESIGFLHQLDMKIVIVLGDQKNSHDLSVYSENLTQNMVESFSRFGIECYPIYEIEKLFDFK
jgi:hypothetical protein